MLADRAIRGLIDEGVLEDADPNRVGPVSYDLRTRSFFSVDGGEQSSCSLGPGDSVFVAAHEVLALPADLSAMVSLKNSRIRQGLTLDAPIYFPGHHTRVFFRVTNVSAQEITLDTSKDIAQVVFEQLEGPVEHPYSGAFVDELDYRGLGEYTDIYDAEMRRLESKGEQIEGIERRMYGNVVELMGIFVAVFALVDVNVAWVSSNLPASAAIVLNLSAVGGLSAMASLIALVVQPKEKAARAIPCAISVAAFVAALIVFLVTK